jgi:hypothetical protein
MSPLRQIKFCQHIINQNSTSVCTCVYVCARACALHECCLMCCNSENVTHVPDCYKKHFCQNNDTK